VPGIFFRYGDLDSNFLLVHGPDQ